MRPFAHALVAAAVLVNPVGAAAGPVSARAERDSGCVAPVSTLPATQQKEITASVNATVEIVNAGGEVSASTTLANNTVLLSQDAFEKEWGLYSLCRQVAKGRISQELYEQVVMKVNGFGQPVASTASTESPPSTPVALAPATGGVTSSVLVGRWVVTVKEKLSSCPKSRDTIVYSWSGEYDAGSGMLTINASGAGTNDSFPILTGRLDGASLRLTGLKADNSAKVDYFLQAGPGGAELTGDMLMAMASGADHMPCAYAAVVTARRP